MEEQFVLRVPPSVAERIEQLLNDPSSSSEDKNLDIVFSGRTGTIVIGKDRFSASLLDLPTVVESYKTYDDNVLIKTADIGQMIMVREEGDGVPEALEYRHGLTPPMRDARRRRFRREPDLNPEVVRRVEKDLQKSWLVELLKLLVLKELRQRIMGMSMLRMRVREWLLHLQLSLMRLMLELLMGSLTGVITMNLMILCDQKPENLDI